MPRRERWLGMKVWQQVCCAAVLDLILGDPPCRLHPVRLMARFAAALEEPCRRSIPSERLAGAVAASGVVATSALAAAGLTRAARRVHPRLGDLVAIVLLYTCFAARDLAVHAKGVEIAVEKEDLPAARTAVGRFVGRDAGDLGYCEVCEPRWRASQRTRWTVSPLRYSMPCWRESRERLPSRPLARLTPFSVTRMSAISSLDGPPPVSMTRRIMSLLASRCHLWLRLRESSGMDPVMWSRLSVGTVGSTPVPTRQSPKRRLQGRSACASAVLCTRTANWSSPPSLAHPKTRCGGGAS